MLENYFWFWSILFDLFAYVCVAKVFLTDLRIQQIIIAHFVLRHKSASCKLDRSVVAGLNFGLFEAEHC